MNNGNVKTPELPDEVNLSVLRTRFLTLKNKLGVDKILDVLVNTDPQYNIVKNGKYNDYKNVLAGKAALKPTYQIVKILENHLEPKQPKKKPRFLKKLVDR